MFVRKKKNKLQQKTLPLFQYMKWYSIRSDRKNVPLNIIGQTITQLSSVLFFPKIKRYFSAVSAMA